MSMAQTFSTETHQWLIVAELFQYLSDPQSSGFTSLPLFLSASRPMGFRNFFFFCIAVKKSDLTQFPLISFLSGLLFSWHYKGLNLSDLISQLHLDNQHTHFILVKISLNRFITDGCSCDQCLQSDDKLEIKACHHYLINLKLSTFRSHSLPFHKPRRAAKTVPGVLTDSGSYHQKVGAGLAVTLKSNTT